MKKILNVLTICGFVFIMTFLTSCEKTYLVPEDHPVLDDVSYSTDMQPFFDAKCISCHNGGGIPLNLDASVSYDALISGNYIDNNNPADSKLYTKIIQGGSMESYATPSERALTLKWIEEGALNN